MKKVILSIAVAASAIAANAQQAIMSNKFFDNWSLGIQGGVYEPTIGQNMLKDMRAGVNIELTKQITPAFGVSANYFAGINPNNGNNKSLLFKQSSSECPKTAFDFGNLGVNGLINLTNLFCGYKGEQRPFEVVARAGAGWGYLFGDCYPQEAGSEVYNTVTANFGLDFNFNASDAVAINIKPAISYWEVGSGLDVKTSNLSLVAGITYKFGNSDGTRGFKVCDKKFTQAQMDEMNDKINGLRGQLAGKDKTIADLEAALAAEKAKDKTVVINKTTTVNQTQLAPVVIFDKGKSVVNAAQQPSVSMIATYMKNHPNAVVTIKGYASPEGSAELNQKLSEARAASVYNLLVNKYGISPSRLKQEGLGATSDVFPENDWNRVCVFLEDAK